MSALKKHRKSLLHRLDQMEHAGLLLYGSHISSSSIISCYVQDMDYGDIHFVGSAGSGYTQASTILKRKTSTGN